MEQRKNRIWGVIRDDLYHDYEAELNGWQDDINKKIISTLRNDEVFSDVNGTHILLCPYCEKPVRVIYQKSVKYPYICHRFDHDAGRCISEDKDKEAESQLIIRARKYEGREIGYLHKQVVSRIVDIIKSCDSYELIRSSETKRVYHIDGQGSYRIPDIYFSHGDLKIAIEVQNSPEWVKVIAERSRFYFENGIYLIWIFTKNSLINNSVSSLDISSHQSFNTFVFDDDCYSKSRDVKKLILLCKYDNYSCYYDERRFKRERLKTQAYVELEELNYKTEKMPYYSDHDDIYLKTEKECDLKNKINEKLVDGIPFGVNENYYWYMLESAYFAKFRTFPAERNIIGRLNHIADCYVAAIFLYGAFKLFGFDYAFSFDKNKTLHGKLKKAQDFWKHLKNDAPEAQEMFNKNHRVSSSTIKEWKSTLTSENNDFGFLFPELNELTSQALRAIALIEKNILHQDC